jgi:predicted phage terminase large subunit-like protein
MNVPPGMMKSLLTGVLFPAWEWGPLGRPSLRYLGTAHKEPLAIRDNTKCRRLIQSEWYRTLWPEVVLTGDQNAKTKFENTKTGFREAMAFSSVTGSRADRITVDDPLSVDGALSDADLKAAELTFTESIPTRVNNDESAIIVIMQRLHERDTSGVILAKQLDYTHLCLPMRFEADRACRTMIFMDPRKVDGQLLFPERFGEKQVADLEKTLGSYATAGQLQQRPAPRSGGLFKRDWFPIQDAAPNDVRWVRGWDFAGTEKKGSAEPAWTAGVKLGVTSDRKFVIGHVVRDRLSPAGVERLLHATATQDGYATKVSIPQDPGQAGKAQVAAFVAKLAGFAVHFSPETGDKITRAEPVAAQAEAGNIVMLRGQWNEAFLDEVSVFPNGQFADQVDALSRAFQHFVLAPRLPTISSGPTKVS